MDTYFLDGCVWVASRATCPRRHVGAILVRDHKIVSTGYNGAPSGEDQCDQVGCAMEDGHCVRTIHAELNCLLQAAEMGRSVHGATIYCTVNPCYNCRKALKQAGITFFIYADSDYVDAHPEIGALQS